MAKQPHPIVLERFGTMTGLKFDDGGYAEIALGRPEIGRVLEALEQHFGRSGKPHPKLRDALQSLRTAIMRSAPELKAETPIGTYRVEFRPVPRQEPAALGAPAGAARASEELDLVEMYRALDEGGRKRARAEMRARAEATVRRGRSPGVRARRETTKSEGG